MKDKLKGIAIFLCDITGVMARPWLEAGYSVVLIDPQHPPGVHKNGAVTLVGHVIDHPVAWREIRNSISTGMVEFVFGFPPCTDLAVSGARWFEDKKKADAAFQFKAMQVVWQCHVIGELSGAPWGVENPVSRISSLWRSPDHLFSPHEFTALCANDNYTKKTCIWSGGGFVMPSKNSDATLPPPDNRIHACPPGPNRANIRSATPLGFAIAVFRANSKCSNFSNDNNLLKPTTPEAS